MFKVQDNKDINEIYNFEFLGYKGRNPIIPNIKILVFVVMFAISAIKTHAAICCFNI